MRPFAPITVNNPFSLWLMSLVVVVGALAPAGAVAAVKKYQVTGNITALTDAVITVDKAGEKFEIERSADLKIDGKLKVGEKVTVYYHMVADSVKEK